ncbi:MAG: cytochrome d ubiquinol oxidase subunit II [Bacilli bacterium]|jgi:cytochrome d ubiquinol oxidase subunit II|nr:cytochrome d ubiquinol oxidase subunit II [Bacilli bacterium]
MSFEFLSNLWFFLLALVWGIYLAQEMFIAGSSILASSFRKDNEKFEVINNAIGTHWDGIQVWLILAVGGTFAAFPNAFASILSNLYIPIFLLLYLIIFRGISIETIDKSHGKLSTVLKWCWFISSAGLLVVLGVYSANMFIGLPLNADGLMNDSFFSFLSIFGMVPIFTALMFVLYALVMGSLFLKMNVEKVVSNKFDKLIKIGSLFASLFLILIFVGLNAKGNIFNRGLFEDIPYLFALPIASCLLSVVGGIAAFKGKYLLAFIFMALGMLLFMITGYLSLVPDFVFSTLDPANSLSIANGAAGEQTLMVMFVSTCIFLPIVLIYQGYKYIRFWGNK